MNNTTVNNLTSIEMSTRLWSTSSNEQSYITILKTFGYVVAMIAALLGNLLIILCYARTKTSKRLERTVNDFLILSLAFSDILLPMFAVPERLTRLYTEGQWVMTGTVGVIMCKMVNFTEAVSIVSSLLTLDAIAMDRCTAVLCPFKKVLTMYWIKRLLACIWFTAVAYNSPLLYFSTVVKQDGKLSCNARTNTWEVKAWLRFYFGLSTVSLLVILCCYAAIAIKMTTTKKSLRKLSISGRQREILSRKILKTSSAIIGAFYLCYFNYWFYALRCYDDDQGQHDICQEKTFRFLSVYLVILNSSVNPLIYFVYSSRYRRGLCRLVTSRKVTQRKLT